MLTYGFFPKRNQAFPSQRKFSKQGMNWKKGRQKRDLKHQRTRDAVIQVSRGLSPIKNRILPQITYLKAVIETLFHAWL
jgi:hypothetical protein